MTAEDGRYGLRAVLHSSWKPWMASYIRDRGIREIELNTGKGWAGTEPAFLRRLQTLLSCNILGIAHPVESVDAIHALPHLLELQELSYSGTPIKFGCFPKLERCSLEWRPGSSSLFETVSLMQLFINRFPGRDSSLFSGLVKMEELSIYNSQISDISGLQSLTHLIELRLVNLRKIDSLSGIENLTNLRILRIDGCRGLSNIDEVAALSQLAKLHVTNCGDISTLAPVSQLRNLEAVLFDGSTRIVDGDLRPLLGAKRALRVSFKNRRHYTHGRADFLDKSTSNDSGHATM